MKSRIYISLKAVLSTLFMLTAAFSQVHAEHNVLTNTEKEQGWKLLFDGKSLDGWHVFQYPDAIPAWQVKAGTLTLDLNRQGVQHGDLATNLEFDNYELRFDWKTTEDGNSGVFINVQETPENNLAWQTGPEYQLLGPAHVDFSKITKRSGCLYGYSAQLTETPVLEQGQWNHAVIKQVDGKAEFYLNGNLTAQVDFNSEQWKAWIATSGFKDFADFGRSTKGRIVLQEWSAPVSFRNIKIKAL